MSSNTAITRYKTPEFQTAPVLSLAGLMGFDASHKREMAKNLGYYGSLLCGIAVHRHLEERAHRNVNLRISQEVPPGRLQSKLQELVVMQRVQPAWYMWSLSDEELREFFDYNNKVTNITGQILPVDPASLATSLTVAGVATAAYDVATKGARSVAIDKVRTIAGSGLVEAISRRLGVSSTVISGAGYVAVPIAITVAGLNLMAKNSSNRARRELAARNLLAYDEL